MKENWCSFKAQLKKKDEEATHAHIAFSWLLTAQEKTNLALDICKKENAELKDELWHRKRNNGNLRERHQDKVSKLRDDMVVWRDSALAGVVRTKVSDGKHAPYTDDFEQFARGLLATGI